MSFETEGNSALRGSNGSASPSKQQQSSSRTGVCVDKSYYRHIANGPEIPDRIDAILRALMREESLLTKFQLISAREATKEEVTLVHTDEVYETVEKFQHGTPDTVHVIDGDTSANIYTLEASLKAIGGLLNVTERVASGALDNGFVIGRPPGHHAESSRSMGFCIFNNVAIAARVAQQKGWAKKVMILDWDVHHGNGTEEIFYRDPSVLYMSVHRGGPQFYPKTGLATRVGEGPGEGFNVNVPFHFDGMGDLEYLTCFKYVFMPIAREFDPDLVIVSAGFDAGSGDPIGPMDVSTEGFEQMMAQVMTLANGRVVCALEGGYNLETTSDACVGCIKVMLGVPPRPVPVAPSSITLDGLRDIYTAMVIQKPYWASLDELLSDLESQAKLEQTEWMDEEGLWRGDETDQPRPRRENYFCSSHSRKKRNHRIIVGPRSRLYSDPELCWKKRQLMAEIEAEYNQQLSKKRSHRVGFLDEYAFSDSEPTTSSESTVPSDDEDLLDQYILDRVNAKHHLQLVKKKTNYFDNDDSSSSEESDSDEPNGAFDNSLFVEAWRRKSDENAMAWQQPRQIEAIGPLVDYDSGEDDGIVRYGSDSESDEISESEVERIMQEGPPHSPPSFTQAWPSPSGSAKKRARTLYYSRYTC